MAPHSSTLAWKTPWMEEPGTLQSISSGFPGGSDSKESACNAGDSGSICVERIPWRREWKPTPVFLPGEFHDQRSLQPIVHGVTKNQT